MYKRQEKCGIYTITNKVDNKLYVGMAFAIKSRLRGHLAHLRANVHANQHLQNSWNKYGEENFVFEILEECDREYLCCQENYWCNMLNTHNREYGYNIQPTSPTGRNVSPSAETREKLRIHNTGKKQTQISIDKRLNTIAEKIKEIGHGFTKGRIQPKEEREKRSKSAKGKTRSEEVCKAISEGLKKRKPLTKEQIQKGADKKKGIKHDAEHSRKTSENGSRLEVEKYDASGNLLCTFYSKFEAAKDANVHYVTMANWCRGTRKSRSKFIYKYKTKEKMKEDQLKEKMGDWARLFKPFTDSEKFTEIFKTLRNKSARGIKIAPESSDVFKAFKLTPPDKVKVIIVGMCPYHTFENNKPIADGLCMSCSYTAKTKGVQPTLDQWYRELERVYGSTMNKQNLYYGDMKWIADQGVLCYNVALTVEENKAESNQMLWADFNKFFWEDIINKYMSGIPIIFLGNSAQKSIAYVNPLLHYCFPLSHPASASYKNTEWDSEGVFKKIDKILKDNNNTYVNWYDDLPF